MASQRHTTKLGLVPAPLERAGTRDGILSAARASVLDVGVRRTTLTDVARRAGVSRMTVYRSFPDVTALVAALMTREFGALLAATAASSADLPTARERLVTSTVAAVRALVDHRLFRRVLDVDPELLLQYVVRRLGGTQKIAARGFADAIGEGQRDGSIRAGEARVMAHALLLTTQSFVLSARVSGAPPRAAVLAELAATLERALRPDPIGSSR